ncbi:MAG TPA: PD-(D/E)XK nuclease family protein, partial [Bacteroidota bacterium]|nr:PD-(D/E)XK nuclease family protein [Bacteroidota bacterium]
RFIQKLLWKHEQSKQDISSDGIEQKIRYSVNLGNRRPEPVKKTTLMIDQIRKNVRFSASALNTYLACPLKFYYRHVLGLKEKIEISDDIESSDIGTIVHTILKEYFKPLIGKRLTREMLDDKKLNAVIEQCFKESFGEDFSGSIYLMKEQVVRQLQSFLLNYQMPMADGSCMITGLERDLTVDDRGFTFTGRIDRIEMRNEKIYILDYKTGYDEKRNSVNVEKLIADRRETWREAIGSFQLPLYMLLYGTFFKKPIEQISPEIIFLGKQPIDQSIEVGIGDEEHSAYDVYRAVEPVMFALLGEILDREKNWFATDTLEAECPRCPFTTMCGTAWVQGWNA